MLMYKKFSKCNVLILENNIIYNDDVLNINNNVNSLNNTYFNKKIINVYHDLFKIYVNIC